MGKHDEVIESIRKGLSQNYTVYINPSSSKTFSVAGVYPDVVVCSKNENRALFIIEVETDESITAGAAFQWQKYSKLPYTFYIVVPEIKIQEAKLLAEQADIVAKFGYYNELPSGGGINVVYE